MNRLQELNIHLFQSLRQKGSSFNFRNLYHEEGGEFVTKELAAIQYCSPSRHFGWKTGNFVFQKCEFGQVELANNWLSCLAEENRCWSLKLQLASQNGCNWVFCWVRNMIGFCAGAHQWESGRGVLCSLQSSSCAAGLSCQLTSNCMWLSHLVTHSCEISPNGDANGRITLMCINWHWTYFCKSVSIHPIM